MMLLGVFFSLFLSRLNFVFCSKENSSLYVFIDRPTDRPTIHKFIDKRTRQFLFCFSGFFGCMCCDNIDLTHSNTQQRNQSAWIISIHWTCANFSVAHILHIQNDIFVNKKKANKIEVQLLDEGDFVGVSQIQMNLVLKVKNLEEIIFLWKKLEVEVEKLSSMDQRHRYPY